VFHHLLEQPLRQAVHAVLPDASPDVVLVRPCPDPKFGDYQTTSLMTVAKERKLNPRQLASDVLGKLEVSQWCEKVELAGPGFINFKLKSEAILSVLQQAGRGEHLFFQKAAAPRTIAIDFAIDFSSPNVAKPMHVGHIRSTILGDSLARTLRLLGERVITDNHVGDWGTQFGMLLVGWKRQLDRAALERDPMAEMERLYKSVNAACQTDEAVREEARQELVRLQQGDPENLAIWLEMISLSQEHFQSVYRRLGVSFDHTLGESFYNPQLKAVVKELLDAGIARESEGAICVFSDGLVPAKEDPFLIHEEGEWKPNPAIIQKRDGGANYTTTDLATLKHRLETWHPNEIIYVTDSRQQLHFRQLFTIFRRWHPEAAVKLAHVWFGSILGDDNRPLKTRSGETVKLKELLDEAEERALAIVSEKNPELSEAQKRDIARVVGISAVKYADLLPNRQSDYVFSWDKMLALSGNTAPYLLYAYARVRSIFRKGAIDPSTLSASELNFSGAEELAVARQLLNFGYVLEMMAEEYRPNYLCNYLYELAGHFARFFETCPVLKSEGLTRSTRLLLCDLTARVMRQGLDVLGIETLEQM
jgi:arginyl-tRNA synthetase